ncbi:hypothetical protein ABI59_13045 [Acidobacteria bacterium Mor1]|nr:hypothetical protein ABI59_13045 [Acidobacteria bacterium Mor1]
MSERALELRTRLGEELALILTRVPRHQVELYRREAEVHSVRRDRMLGGRARSSRGHDQGVAIRLLSIDQRAAFASASGSGPLSVHRVLDRALQGEWSPVDDATLWGEDSGLEDHRESARSPLDRPQLEAALDRVCATLEGAGRGRGRGWRVISGQVDGVHVFEALAAGDGLSASRSRRRVSADVWLQPESGDRPALRCALLAEGAEELDARPWVEATPLWGDAGAPDHLLSADAPWLVPPVLASEWVAALVADVHGGAAQLGAPVGPGWFIEDAPREPGAPFGGLFDDAGFPTARRVLAAGRTVDAAVHPVGSLRRGSFRDRPEPRPAHLRVKAGSEGFPSSAWVVTAARIDPVEAGWLLDLELQALDEGGPAGAPRRCAVEVAPYTLVRACRAAVGTPYRSHLGVEVPWLLLDPLDRVRG